MASSDGGGSDVFVHVHDVEAAGMKTLVAGQWLGYDIGAARDGRLKAINLRLLNPELLGPEDDRSEAKMSKRGRRGR
jgi:cold shock CspA family protein